MKLCHFIILIILGQTAWTQTNIHRKVSDTFIERFNNGDFESIRESYSVQFKAARTKNQTLNFLKRIKTEHGNLRLLEMEQYQPLKGKLERVFYQGHFENGILTVRLTTNAKGEITGLLIRRNTYL